jgi:hypothetical protein
MTRISGFPTVAGDYARGRTSDARSPSKRRRHIRCAYCRLIQRRSPQWITRHFDISRRTMQLWIKAALSYDDPESLILRTMVAGGADAAR